MQAKPKGCKGCPWYEKSYGYIAPFGDCSNGVALVSDYPELDDIGNGAPFSWGRPADMFRRTMRRLKEKATNYGITYIVRCKPKGKAGAKRPALEDYPDHDAAIKFCRGAHGGAVQQWGERIKAIAPLGPTALEQYTGVPASDRTRGYVYRPKNSPPVVGTYHFAYVGAGNTGLLFTLRYDLATINSKVDPQFGKAPKRFVMDPDPATFKRFVDDILRLASWCVVDIETPMAGDDESEYSKKKHSFGILRVSFCASHDPTLSVSIQFMPHYYPDVERLMKSGIDIVYWNGDYDDPRLAYNGFTRAGRFVDAMWLWHFLQPDLPKALAHVATYFTDLPEWKSLSEDEPAYYSCCDSYAEAQCYIAILAALEKKGMREVAERHVTELLGILRDMRARGINTDAKAIEKVREHCAAKLETWDASARALYPDALCKTKWYKKAPPGVKRGTIHAGTRKLLAGKPGRYICDGTGEADGRWGFRWDFNPASADQLKEYLRARSIKIPRSYKTKRETTDNRALTRLYARTGDPLLQVLLDRSKVAKILSTYTNWTLDNSGRVHPTLLPTPATGRLSCERPNFQNNPKEGELAAMVRNCIRASEGCKLITADYVGMESFLTGYFAGDELYIALSEMNLYTYVVAKYMGWEVSDDAKILAEQIKKYKKKAKGILKDGENKTLYDKFKTIVLAIGYGCGRNTLFYTNPGVFKDLAETGQLRGFYFETFPKIEKWQRDTIALASQGYLFNPFMYIRYFLDCPGSDSTVALAQPGQSTGAAIIKECMLQFNKTWLSPYLVLQVHDELVWDTPKAKVPEAKKLIRKIMEQPWPQLNGRSIKVTIKDGDTLSEMED